MDQGQAKYKAIVKEILIQKQNTHNCNSSGTLKETISTSYPHHSVSFDMKYGPLLVKFFEFIILVNFINY